MTRPRTRRTRSGRAAAIGIAFLAAAAGGVAGCAAGASTSRTQSIPRVSGRKVDAKTPHGSGAPTATSPTATLPGDNRPTILLGNMNTPEQFILGDLYRLALEAQGYRVSLSPNIGPTAIRLAAMKQQSLDIYPEYLNVWDQTIAGVHRRPQSLPDAYRIGEAYARRQHLTLLAPTPFSDTSGIAVRTRYARRHGLRTLLDLRSVASRLTLGGPLEFTQDPGGLPTVEHAYGLGTVATKAVAIGAQYAALQHHDIAAAYVGTSDPELSQPEFRVLADPKHVFGFGNVVPVVSTAALKADGPVFARTINRVDRLLTQSAIRGLNFEVETAQEKPEEVAMEFLQGNGILPPPVYSTSTATTRTEAAGTPPGA